jgi:hypothetical protein
MVPMIVLTEGTSSGAPGSTKSFSMSMTRRASLAISETTSGIPTWRDLIISDFPQTKMQYPAGAGLHIAGFTSFQF